MANWKSFDIQVPGKNLLQPVDSALETLLVFLDVLKAILDTIKVFLIDFGNPVVALVQALIQLIESLFTSLKQSGVFAYFDVPDPTSDPNFDHYSGGFPAFTTRFKASLFDAKDFNRPQPQIGSDSSGFVLLVVDAESPYALLARIKQLMRFFGREFTSPRFEPPVNLKASLVGSNGDPILKVASIFAGSAVSGIELQWTLASSVETPNPGFTDLVTKVAEEAIPPNYLIERSVVNPASKKIDVSDMATATASGQVTFNRVTYTNIGNSSQPVMRRGPLLDEYRDPVIKFRTYRVLSNTSITAILGDLGTFRYIDHDVTPGTTYYYRVRAYSGSLALAGDQVAWPISAIDSTYPVLYWPSSVPNESVIVGKSSGVVSATMPIGIPANFDVVGDLRALFQTAFSLDFQLQADKGSTAPTQIGRGSLSAMAASMAVYQAFTVVGELLSAATVVLGFSPDPITGLSPVLPWQVTALRRESARLADAVASALLQAGPEALNGFRSIMQGPLPAGAVSTGFNLRGVTSLEGLVKGFTILDAQGNADSNGAQTFAAGYSDAGVRSNVLAGIQFVKVYSLGGTGADWISVEPLRDIIPWAGQLIYDLMDKIQALLDAFGGVMTEIKTFIDLIERKIAALERFIEFLINILNTIANLQLGAYVLSVPSLTGGSQSWVSAIDSAGGTIPPSGPGGYSSGVGLAYVATDITAFKNAFSIIFG